MMDDLIEVKTKEDLGFLFFMQEKKK